MSLYILLVLARGVISDYIIEWVMRSGRQKSMGEEGMRGKIQVEG